MAEEKTIAEQIKDAFKQVFNAAEEDDKDKKIKDLEEKLDRLMHIAEQQFKISYINVLIAKEGKNDLAEKMPVFQDKANQALATSLVGKFGE